MGFYFLFKIFSCRVFWVHAPTGNPAWRRASMYGLCIVGGVVQKGSIALSMGMRICCGIQIGVSGFILRRKIKITQNP
jgi:hypothetical protein